MPPEPTRSHARLLAPLALVAFVLALLLVIASGTGDGGGDSTNQAGESEQTSAGNEQRLGKRGGGSRDTYTVKKGDTLGEISQDKGVPVEKLEELNPDLDPRELVSGQTIKLRE